MSWANIIPAVANLASGFLGRKSTEAANAANIKHQKQFAQQGIQWKVADAEKAGVHPLFALGASTHSFAPSSVGDSSLPSALSSMGQDVGRAVQSTMDAPQKAVTMAHQLKMNELTLQRAELENTLLASKIATANQVQSTPAMSSPTSAHLIEGQGDVPVFQADPRVAHITAPSSVVDAGKSFGLGLVRNPRLFSSGQWMEDEFGENPFQHVHGAAAYLEALSQSLMRKNLYDIRRGKQMWKRR